MTPKLPILIYTYTRTCFGANNNMKSIHLTGPLHGIVGESAAIKKIFAMIEKVAGSDSTVLIYGESGTGKELVARAIHNNSKRVDNPLIPINCGAIPEGLMESELFGHEKGAFTGAMKTRIGKFETAHNSTIFLDEVADMSPALQVKILRVLQEHEFERIGGTKSIKIDVRVIAATNKNLEKSIEDNRFREDLYYRLNVIPINIPPLRDRKEDIPLLVDYFVKYFNKTKGKNIKGISEKAINIMLGYSWPGNVRELENIIERTVILKGEGTIEDEDMPEKMLGSHSVNNRFPLLEPNDTICSEVYLPDNGICLKTALDELEKDLILRALKKSNWVKNKAAKLLRLNRTTLIEKIKKIGITKEH